MKQSIPFPKGGIPFFYESSTGLTKPGFPFGRYFSPARNAFMVSIAFHFSPKASSYLVFSWPPRLPKLWKLGTLTPRRTRPNIFFCDLYCEHTNVFLFFFIIIKDKWINNFIVSYHYDIARLLLLFKVYPTVFVLSWLGGGVEVNKNLLSLQDWLEGQWMTMDMV